MSVAVWYPEWMSLLFSWRFLFAFVVVLVCVLAVYYLIELVFRPERRIAERRAQNLVLDSAGKDLPYCETCRCWHPVGVHYPEQPVRDPVSSVDVWVKWNKERS
jgi:hypothetical protein